MLIYCSGVCQTRGDREVAGHKFSLYFFPAQICSKKPLFSISST
jgi:hypothetical protein